MHRTKKVDANTASNGQFSYLKISVLHTKAMLVTFGPFKNKKDALRKLDELNR